MDTSQKTQIKKKTDKKTSAKKTDKKTSDKKTDKKTSAKKTDKKTSAKKTISKKTDNPTELKEDISLDVETTLNLEDGDAVEFERVYMYKLCCANVDKRALTFFAQTFFSITIVSFCIGMLARNQDEKTFDRYMPLLTFIVGVWIPQPKMSKT